MRQILFAVALLAWGLTASADDIKFSTHLHKKFQVKGCTTCHDFFEKKLGGIFYKDHNGRSPDMCIHCHTKEVIGFEHADEWFARPGLYTSDMDAKQTCEVLKTVLHAKFKNSEMMAREIEKHLFEDPRVLWAIEGATPKSGNLPHGKKETDLVKGGLREWKDQVGAWVRGGMKCE